MTKFNALDQLAEMHASKQRQAYPTVPDHARPRVKFRDNTANELTKSIVRFLELKGHAVWRQSSEGRYRPGEVITDVIGRARQLPGKWLPGQNKGAGDVSAIIHSRFVSIEVKVGHDRQRSQQKRFQKLIEESGGCYLIVKTFAEFVTKYENIANP